MITKISIVVPCYKRVKQTLKTIKMIFASDGWGTLYKAEVIVADVTPDNSLKQALFQKFGEKAEKNEFSYIRPKKSGISTNKNIGAKKAKFPILVFCDSDMEVEKNTIMATIKALKEHKKAAAITGNIVWRGGENNGKFDRPRKEDRMVKIRKTIFIEAIYSRYVATYKEVFQAVGGYDEKVFNMRGEGSDMSIRSWRAGYPLVYDASIKAHHVANSSDSIALGIKHPEWGIAKDLLLLAYKYDILGGDHKNFVQTVKANFDKFGASGYYKIIEGIGKNLDFITKSKKEIESQKKKMKPKHDFKFLEIFSNKALYLECINKAEKKLDKIRKKAF
ncbi:glycosyltransferase family 2 protein [Candidatus Parcubacteria bacterium]|nr:glycosyltransferase family 2 protein [Candidatus Parcubacteria bacterium]